MHVQLSKELSEWWLITNYKTMCTNMTTKGKKCHCSINRKDKQTKIIVLEGNKLRLSICLIEFFWIYNSALRFGFFV